MATLSPSPWWVIERLSVNVAGGFFVVSASVCIIIDIEPMNPQWKAALSLVLSFLNCAAPQERVGGEKGAFGGV